MNRSKVFWSIALALVLLFGLLPSAALASDLDTTRTSTLTLVDEHNGTYIPGAAFRLYRVGDVDGETAALSLTDDFKNSGVNLQGSATWSELASTLEGYVVRQIANGTDLTPAASGTTDSSGRLTFDPLPTGLYLLVGDQITMDSTIYTPTPSLLTLPYTTNSANRNWNYTPTVYAKNSVTTKTTPPDTPSNPGSSSYSLSVVKVWEDDDGTEARPQSITVTLYRGTSVYSAVTLSEENNWRHTWRGLSSTSNFTLSEDAVPEGYSVTVVRNGNSFVVTNTYTPPDQPTPSDEPDTPPADTPDTPDTPAPDEPVTPDTPVTPSTPTVTTTSTPTTPAATTEKLPQTGQLWWPVSVLAASGLAMVALGECIRRRGGRHES